MARFYRQNNRKYHYIIAHSLVLTNIFLCYRTSFTCITLASSSFSFIALLLVLSNIFCLYNVRGIEHVLCTERGCIQYNRDVCTHDIDVTILRGTQREYS